MSFSLKVVQQRLFLQLTPRRLCSRKMSSNADEVLFDVKKKGGFITLNRQKALNALNTNMVELITQKLCEWEKCMNYIVVKGAGRAFCAGGDIVSVTKGGPQCTVLGEDFFRTEYAMNYRISKLSIPYIAIIDGITMGGGVGLSVHGRYRIATENTMFAMPETAIGLFPDVGGSHFLSRLGPLGMFLALTGHRLQSIDVAKSGVATHFIDSGKLPELLQDIENNANESNVDKIINNHAKCLKSHDFSLNTKLGLINSAFAKPTLEAMIEELKQDGSEWSLNTIKVLNKMSPTSLKITVRELNEGKNKSLKECLQMEFRLAVAALKGKVSNDFYEGVRALLVDKDKKPVWNPPNIEAVNDYILDLAFENFPCPSDELQL